MKFLRLMSRAALAIGFIAGCETRELSPFVGGEGDAPFVPSSCSTPKEGCPCANEGQTVECTNVVQQSTEYSTCSVGVRTCSGGKYTACVEDGSEMRTGALNSGSGKRLMALGSSQNCAATNPCSPDCNSYTDSAGGLVIPPGDDVTLSSTGVTLIQSETPATGTPCTSLSISPSPATLTITQFSPVSPATVQFSAALSPVGCYPGVPPVVWAIDRFDVATISNTGLLTMVSPNAGAITVTGYAGSLSATATLNVKLAVVDTSGAPAGTASRFPVSTGAADAATVLYPYANTVLPLALQPPLVQWSTGSTGAASAVKLSVRYPATGAAVFEWSQIIAESRTLPLNPPTNTITLAAGPRASIPANVWTAFERTAKGQEAAIVLQRLTGATLRAEIKTPIRFGTGQLKGTVYYQSYGTNLVQNFGNTYATQTIGANQRFGAATLAIRPGATYPTVAAGYTSPTNGPGCRVCHTAAAGGSSIVSNIYGSADTVLFRLGTDAANAGVAFPAKNDGKYSWSAVYPDGSLIFSNSGPSQSYAVPGATPPGGLEDTAVCTSSSTSPCTSALNGQAPPNSLYSLAPATIGNVVSSTGIPAALRAAMPVFSPDGSMLAFNHYAGTVGSIAGDKRSIGLMDFNVGTKKFTNFRRLVTAPTSACSSAFGTSDPCTYVWPTILPGNGGVVFEREIFNNGRVSGAGHSDFGGTRSGCDGSGTCGDDGTKADLWWVTTAATPVAAPLKKANGFNADGTLYLPTGTNSHTATIEPVLNYEPTMSPTAVGGYYWMAFTSRRLYGNVATVNPWWSDPRFKPIGGDNGPTTKKIWISAINLNPASGSDPSHPPFYLPGQELLSGNSKAYWVLNSCVTASSTRSTATECESDLDCCSAPGSAVCSLQTPITSPAKRHCIPKTFSQCVEDESDAQCSSDAQCCGFSTGSRCANGECKLPAPLLTYSPGDYVRDFHAECSSSTRPVWQVFQWQAKLPVGTSITFTAATAATSAGLATAAFVPAGTALPPDTTTWATNTVNIQKNLKQIGTTSQDYLRVKMALNPTDDRLVAPTLTNWRVLYDCVDAQ